MTVPLEASAIPNKITSVQMSRIDSERMQCAMVYELIYFCPWIRLIGEGASVLFIVYCSSMLSGAGYLHSARLCHALK